MINSLTKIFFSTKYTEKNECEKCSHKICCVVFDICKEVNQGRETIMQKPGGLRCPHLDADGMCKSYQNQRFSGCESYSCENLGPLVSDRIDTFQLDIIQDSKLISHIMDTAVIFISNSESKKEKEAKKIFLKNFLFNNTISTITKKISHLQKDFKKYNREARI